MQELRPTATLRALHNGGVSFILVGGLAAVLNGAPVNTFDVDVVHSRDSANVARLLPVLEAIGIQPERHLVSVGNLNLITRYGPLDLLGTIGNNLAYEDLVPRSVELDIG
jgi:hypothetical protein